jgi:hypothetical protein
MMKRDWPIVVLCVLGTLAVFVPLTILGCESWFRQGDECRNKGGTIVCTGGADVWVCECRVK